MPRNRLFVGLQPSADTLMQIDRWRSHNLPLLGRPVAIQNLHITICFLGDVGEAQLQGFCSVLDRKPLGPIDTSLDTLGFWPKQQVCFLSPSRIPESLNAVHRACSSAARAARIPTDKRQFAPHLTLARKVADTPPAALVEPDFEVSFDELLLLSSRLRPEGPVYGIIRGWPLIDT